VSLERLGRLREGVYRFTGAGLSYPTAELLDAAATTVPVLAELGLFDYAFALPVVDAAEELADSELRDLEIAHAALFEAGVGGAACSPHLTTYVVDPGSGDVARVQVELRATYRRFGIGDAIADGDMVDHVATEMEVMARLCADEVRRRVDDDEPAIAVRRQAELITRYVAPWIPTFANRMTEVDGHRAYTSLAIAAHAIVEHERELVPLLLSTTASEQ
jgi:TorA maturation chaperone TorD